jgi:HAD superfamily hydrolase (TIGR01484 family)
VSGPSPLPVPPRLVATDLDGTLLRDDGEVSDRTRRALAATEAAGIEIVFVTARPPRWVDVLADVVGGHGTVICLNGALVYDASTRAVRAEHAMADAVVEGMVADLREAVPGIVFACERAAGFAVEHGFRSVHPVPAGTPHADRIEAVLDGATGKLLARSLELPDDELIGRVDDVLAGRAIVADSGAIGLAEVTGPQVTKAATLASWAAERGVGPADVWAFGDMPNDLAMLEWAGRSFAVGNAHPAVRRIADEVCATNQEDGVAGVLEAMLGRLGPLEDATHVPEPGRLGSPVTTDTTSRRAR